MRVGGTIFSSGFRDWRAKSGGKKPCAACALLDGPNHSLLACQNPKLVATLCRLRTALLAARKKEEERRVLAAKWRGLPCPAPRKSNSCVRVSDLSYHPNEVLSYIHEGRFWIDSIVRSSRADRVTGKRC